MDFVDVEPIQKAVNKALSNGMTLSDICRNIGWVEYYPKAETSRLKRYIGLMPKASHGRYRYNKTMCIVNAELILRAIDIDPIDIGL